MSGIEDGYRSATLIVLDPAGRVLGRLPPVRVDVPWFQEVRELVAAAHDAWAVEITVLRLLDADTTTLPAITITYLAEVKDGSDITGLPLSPWHGMLDDQALRLPWAKPGGPAAALDWADDALDRAGYGTVTSAIQVRTWNLSSIWQLDTAHGRYWLKCVPAFFAHEGAVIRLLEDEQVPRLVAADTCRILMHDLPGTDCYDASIELILIMIERLVDLQWRWAPRISTLVAAGVPDLTDDQLATGITETFARHVDGIDPRYRDVLTRFVSELPQRLDAIAAHGLPRTLVHGDYHPGNWRGTRGLDHPDGHVAILDWGDCFISHPLLDMPGLLERATEDPRLVDVWARAWRRRLPGVDIPALLHAIKPVAAARMAATYQLFLDHIEPSERVYHAADPVTSLNRTGALLLAETG